MSVYLWFICVNVRYLVLCLVILLAARNTCISFRKKIKIAKSLTPDPKEREEGSVGFERVRHPPIEFTSWELWE